MVGLLGGVLRDQNKLSEAEPLFQQAVETNRRLYGDGHANTAMSRGERPCTGVYLDRDPPADPVAEPSVRQVTDVRHGVGQDQHE